MEAYKLIELSGTESDNDIVHFANFEVSATTKSLSNHPPRKKRLKR